MMDMCDTHFSCNSVRNSDSPSYIKMYFWLVYPANEEDYSTDFNEMSLQATLCKKST